eukprot:1068011-Karenia_brevis.AAC.1
MLVDNRDTAAYGSTINFQKDGAGNQSPLGGQPMPSSGVRSTSLQSFWTHGSASACGPPSGVPN